MKDALVLEEMKKMRREGKDTARAGEVARRLHIDSVDALGAMERVKGVYRRWVNKRESK